MMKLTTIWFERNIWMKFLASVSVPHESEINLGEWWTTFVEDCVALAVRGRSSGWWHRRSRLMRQLGHYAERDSKWWKRRNRLMKELGY